MQPKIEYSPFTGWKLIEAADPVECRGADSPPWRFNPWTGLARSAEDIVSDPQGRGIWVLDRANGSKMAAEIKPEVDAPALGRQVGGEHYKALAIQPVEYIHRNGLGFIEGSVVKYVTRWRAKGGVEDLRKARHFLDLLLEMEGD